MDGAAHLRSSGKVMAIRDACIPVGVDGADANVQIAENIFDHGPVAAGYLLDAGQFRLPPSRVCGIVFPRQASILPGFREHLTEWPEDEELSPP